MTKDIRKERILIKTSLTTEMHWGLRRVAGGKIGNPIYRGDTALRESWPERLVQ
jgi:hypothetical protein